MSVHLRNFKNRLSSFHNDESGEQTMGTIMILGVAALVIVGLVAIGVFVFNKTNTKLTSATADSTMPGPK